MCNVAYTLKKYQLVSKVVINEKSRCALSGKEHTVLCPWARHCTFLASESMCTVYWCINNSVFISVNVGQWITIGEWLLSSCMSIIDM